MCKEKYVLLYLVKALIVLPLGDVKNVEKCTPLNWLHLSATLFLPVSSWNSSSIQTLFWHVRCTYIYYCDCFCNLSKIITGGEFFYLFQFVQSFLSSIIITARILQFTNGRMWWWWWYYRLSLIFTQGLPNTLLRWNQPFFENHPMFLWVKNGGEIELKRI